MPIQFASPGVYIQEVPSGVRTIAGVATSVAAFRDDINAAMTSLGGGYQLTTMDLSSFPDYA